MLDFEPQDRTVAEVHKFLLGGVGPRPIALVSTVSADGRVNLSPFSFFNVFGANPPTIAFSPSRRVRDNTVKDTYNNLLATPECVVQAVTYDMVQQVSLASTEYETGVDEFVKSGLTKIASDIVKPPRVKESPFQMECRLLQMLPLGEGPGSGNLAICKVVKFHVDERILDNGVIHPQKIDLVARMSADFYCRANGGAIFEVAKPVGRNGVGVDSLPDFVRESSVLSANNLGQLGNCERIPDQGEVLEFVESFPPLMGGEDDLVRLQQTGEYRSLFRVARALDRTDPGSASQWMVLSAKRALEVNDTQFAWCALLYSHRLAN